jgi:hypothetical protein
MEPELRAPDQLLPEPTELLIVFLLIAKQRTTSIFAQTTTASTHGITSQTLFRLFPTEDNQVA